MLQTPCGQGRIIHRGLNAFLRQPISYMSIIMAALRSRCGHYIFALWFLSTFFYSSPNLSGRRLDVYHTSSSTYGVTLVQI